MIRDLASDGDVALRLPRTRGDDPTAADELEQLKAFAPHSRG